VDIIEMYEKVLNGSLKKFPYGTWNDKENVIRVTRHMIETKLKWSHQEVCQNLSAKVFRDNKLSGLLSTVYDDSPYEALEAAYPGEYHRWELKVVPKGSWTQENGVKATRWLIEEKLKWSREEVCANLDIYTFIDNNLDTMLNYCFSYSPHEALEATYPSVYKPWELKNVPRFFWNQETGIAATKWLIEEKLNWTVEKARIEGTTPLFAQNGLSGMLQTCFGGSARRAIATAYPEE